MSKPHQAHGRGSKVYTPVLLAIFKRKYVEGAERIAFTLDDVRAELAAQGVEARNAPDLIYRMKSRTRLPDEIQSAGYKILEITSRGQYALVRGVSTLIDYPDESDVVELEDRTPPVVRKLLYENLGDVDEQGLLSVLRYNDLFSSFLGVPSYHLKSHVRRSVPGVGQAEVDDVYIATGQGDTTIVPVEAKAKDDPVNRTQITMQIRYAHHAFPGHPVRPLTVKLFETGVVLFMEFNPTTLPNELRIVRHRFLKLRPPP